MPLYTYRCISCEERFDKNLSIANRKEPEESPCPSCNEDATILHCVGTPMVCYSMSPGLRVTDNFNDRLKDLKKGKGRGCTIETKN
jgi:putative FmdB family regulatory protein